MASKTSEVRGIRMQKVLLEKIDREARRRGLSVNLWITTALAAAVERASKEEVREGFVIPGRAPEEQPGFGRQPGSLGLELEEGKIKGYVQVPKPGSPELTEAQAKELLQKRLPPPAA
jgi:hypothetical protein